MIRWLLALICATLLLNVFTAVRAQENSIRFNDCSVQMVDVDPSRGIRIREGAGTNFPVITTDGGRFLLMGEQDGWVKLSIVTLDYRGTTRYIVDQKTGWVRKDLAKVYEASLAIRNKVEITSGRIETVRQLEPQVAQRLISVQLGQSSFRLNLANGQIVDCGQFELISKSSGFDTTPIPATLTEDQAFQILKEEVNDEYPDEVRGYCTLQIASCLYVPEFKVTQTYTGDNITVEQQYHFMANVWLSLNGEARMIPVSHPWGYSEVTEFPDGVALWRTNTDQWDTPCYNIQGVQGLTFFEFGFCRAVELRPTVDGFIAFGEERILHATFGDSEAGGESPSFSHLRFYDSDPYGNWLAVVGSYGGEYILTNED